MRFRDGKIFVFALCVIDFCDEYLALFRFKAATVLNDTSIFYVKPYLNIVALMYFNNMLYLLSIEFPFSNSILHAQIIAAYHR